MKVNWLKALPVGSHVRETLEDIKIIRFGARKSKKGPARPIAYESNPVKR